MTTEQKIIRTKVGVLELAKHLGNISSACQVVVPQHSIAGKRMGQMQLVDPTPHVRPVTDTSVGW